MPGSRKPANDLTNFQKSYESRFPRSFPENFSLPQLAMKPLLNSRPYWVTIIALLTKASGPFRPGYSLYGLPSGSCWKAWLHLWVTACQQSSLVSDRSRAQVTGSPNHHEVLQRVPGAQLHFLTITQLGSISSTALSSSHSAPRLAYFATGSPNAGALSDGLLPWFQDLFIKNNFLELRDRRNYVHAWRLLKDLSN